MKTSIQNPFSGGLAAFTNLANNNTQMQGLSKGIQGLGQSINKSNIQDLMRQNPNQFTPGMNALSLGMNQQDQAQYRGLQSDDRSRIQEGRLQQGEDRQQELQQGRVDRSGIKTLADQQAHDQSLVMDPLKQQQAQATLTGTQDKNTLFGDALGRYNAQTETTLNTPVGQTPEANNYQGSMQQLTDLNALGISPTTTKDRKPTSFEELDRWQSELAGLSSLGNNLNPAQQVRKTFLSKGITKYQEGSSTVAQNTNELQISNDLNRTNNFEKQGYLKDPKAADSIALGQMSGVEERQMANKGSQAVKSAQTSIDTMKGNHLTVNNIQDVMDMNAKGEFKAIDKGAVGNIVQGLQKMVGSDHLSKESADAVNAQIKLDTNVGRLAAQYVKMVSGATVTDNEKAQLMRIFTGGEYADEATIMTAMNEFKDSLIRENDNLAGQNFQTAPHSSTKYRKYNTPYAKPQTQQQAPVKVGNYNVGQVYTDADGNSATLQADGSWKE